MVTATVGINSTGTIMLNKFFHSINMKCRPISNDVTESLLRRAKAAGFTALVVTLDTMMLGWRPHDLERAYLPFAHGLGVQIGASDPAFMSHRGKQPITESKRWWPYEAHVHDKKLMEGDEEAKFNAFLGTQWLQETNSGKFRTWKDLKHLRDNWEGPLILKGIQNVAVRTQYISYPRSFSIAHGEISDADFWWSFRTRRRL